jgi:serine/threonine protein kinase/tetratricopeptide (TPR) repeat protein
MSILRPGSVFANRFAIDRIAGAGGMGTVYRATDLTTDQVVALKMLHHRGGNKADSDRFLREADILARLEHPGIVAHVAHGQTSDGDCYLAMEWLEGEDLAQRLERSALSLAESVQLIRRVAETMVVVHEQGVVHRDLKPRNLFLPGSDPAAVKVLDFGIARRSVTLHSMTATGRLIGTPAYMAPEQVAGKKEITPATDIYSLGCIFYECLTGEPPFEGEQLYALLVCILFEEIRPVSARRPDVPLQVSELITRMLAKDPAHRIPSAQALLGELSRLRLSLHEPAPALEDLRQPAPGFAEREQALISLVIATPTEGPILLPPSGLASSDQLSSERRHSLLVLLQSFGVQAEVLLNGSLVVSVPPTPSANDQAVQAARIALLIKDAWPSAEVVVATGRGTAQGTTTLGEVADRAARLLHRRADSSRAGSVRAASGVWVDELSARLLGDRFVMQFGGPDVLLLGQAKAEDVDRPLLGKPTSCVGRDAELTMMETQLSACINESEPLGLVLTAPPGVGKSRLRHEFLRRIEKQTLGITVLKGRGDMMSAGAPFGILANTLRQLCDIKGGEELAAQRAALRERIPRHLPAGQQDRPLAFLGELCGVPFDDVAVSEVQAARRDPQIMRESIQRAFLDWLAAECRHSPVLFVLDDLQWADALTISLLHEALLANRGAPLCILALARPEVYQRFSGLWQGQNVQHIALKGLSRKASERLIHQVLGPKVASDVVARIIEQASGNALYLEELIRAAAEGSLSGQPETVLAMLQARVGHFDTGPRRALFAASIYGESFWRGGVAAVLGITATHAELDSWFATLVQQETIEPCAGTRFANEREYRFRHALLREAAYALVADQDRRLGHHMACQFLEARGEGDAMVMADHAQRGGDLHNAATLYARAAEQCFDRQDLHGVLHRSELGLACGATAETLGQLRAMQSAAYMWGEDWTAAYQTGIEALGELEHGSTRWLRTLSYLFVIGGNLQDQEPLQKLFGLFASIDPARSDPAAYIQCAGFVNVIFSYVGLRPMAEPLLRSLQALVQHVPKTDILSHSTVLWAESQFHYYLTPNAYRAAVSAEQAASLLRNTEALRALCVRQVAQGFTQVRIGNVAAGVQTLRDNLLLAQRLNEPFNISMTDLYLGQSIVLMPDRLAEANEIAARGLANEQNGRPGVIGGHSWTRAMYCLALGQLAEAEEAARVATRTLSTLPIHHTQALVVLAKILLKQGRVGEARSAGDEALRIIDSCGGVGVGDIAARVVAAEAHVADSDSEGARAILAEALTRLRLGADEIAEARLRECYLNGVPEHRRAQELASELGLTA